MKLLIIRFLDKYVSSIFVFLFGFLTKKNIKTPTYGVSPRFLLIKFWGLGNLALLSPTITALKTKYPQANISFLTLQSNNEFTTLHPLINDSLFIHDSSIVGIIRDCIAFSLQKRNAYDVIIDCEQFSNTTAIITFLLAPLMSIGFSNSASSRNRMYHTSIPYYDQHHMACLFTELLGPLGIPPIDLAVVRKLMSFPLSCIALPSDKKTPVNNRIMIVIHAGSSANSQIRRWPQEYFCSLIQQLIIDFKANIVLTGTGMDQEINTYLESEINSVLLQNKTNNLSIKELVCLIKQADFVISNDTAPVHIASMFNVPTIAFFGPNTPEIYGSLSDSHLHLYSKMKCSPCINNYNYKTNRCSAPLCMTRLTVDVVYPAIQHFMQNLPNCNHPS